jgi:drug/metabolite transporter (DMT)-like permease
VPQSAPQPGPKTLAADIASLAVCSLIWGTTWRAIKLEVGVTPTAVSVVYRFALASLLLVAVCLATGRSLSLTRRQHAEVFAQGAVGFCLQYGLVYWVEQTMSSGALAVIFAAVAFVSLIVFRIALGQKASPLAWFGSLLGLGGVAAMSLSQIGAQGPQDVGVVVISLAFLGVLAAVISNLFAARAQRAGVAVAPGTAWAMGYGAALMALWVIVTGQPWRFDPSVRYVGGLLYLSVFGSVVAFVVFYALARRRGYALASYVAALTPPTAMVISSLTESVMWGPAAFAGLVLVLAGQVLLIRGSKT